MKYSSISAPVIIPKETVRQENNSSNLKARRKQDKLDSSMTFDRTNRLELNWIRELCVLSLSNYTEHEANSAVNLVIEIARTLLFSNIPEQVVDLFALYQEILSRKRLRDDSFVDMALPHPKLVSITARALIRLDDVPSALKLLKAVARYGLEFDADTRSTIVADLAEKSHGGLQAALLIRKSMRDRNQTLSTVGAISILKVSMHVCPLT